jgi:hypothetical protein
VGSAAANSMPVSTSRPTSAVSVAARKASKSRGGNSPSATISLGMQGRSKKAWHQIQ